MLDFSQVKGVVIPQGDVIRIEISGNIVWEKEPTNVTPLSINPDGTINEEII